MKQAGPKLHHLYEIRDSVFKYGISSEAIGKDGYSQRMRQQVDLGNLFVGWIRFFAHILIRNIPGRAQAEALEDEHIEVYKQATGKMPTGNRRMNKKR